MKLKAMLYVPEDKEDFQIEVYDEDQSLQVAEIYTDDRKVIKIEFFNNPNKNSWEIELKYLIDFLEKSFKELDV